MLLLGQFISFSLQFGFCSCFVTLFLQDTIREERERVILDLRRSSFSTEDPDISRRLASLRFDNYEDLTTEICKIPFQELFFGALPLLVHPIIFLRLLCHIMFGKRIRRKEEPQQQVPPVPVPAGPQKSSDRIRARVETMPSGGEVSTGSKRRKAKLHVQISSPKSDEEVCVMTRRRQARAGSVDKGLLHFGSAKRNGTTSLAIKAIGDSLVQPLDLNLSPTSGTTGLGEYRPSKRIFRFPSMKKRLSKSHGNLNQLARRTSYVDGVSAVSKDSVSSPQDVEIKALQRELINLPTFEMDTTHFELSTSPLLRRSHSVPEFMDPKAYLKSIVKITLPYQGESQDCSDSDSKLSLDKAGNVTVHFSPSPTVESPVFGRNLTEEAPAQKDTVSFQGGSPSKLHLPLSPKSSITRNRQERQSPVTLHHAQSPLGEIPATHRAVMKVIEMWTQVCVADLEANVQVKKEMKDFIQRMAGLGSEYKPWCHRIWELLKLEVGTVSDKQFEQFFRCATMYCLYKHM